MQMQTAGLLLQEQSDVHVRGHLGLSESGGELNICSRPLQADSLPILAASLAWAAEAHASKQQNASQNTQKRSRLRRLQAFTRQLTGRLGDPLLWSASSGPQAEGIPVYHGRPLGILGDPWGRRVRRFSWALHQAPSHAGSPPLGVSQNSKNTYFTGPVCRILSNLINLLKRRSRCVHRSFATGISPSADGPCPGLRRTPPALEMFGRFSL